MKVKEIFDKWTSISLVLRILVGLIIGVVLALVIPSLEPLYLPGNLFINALKAIAPFLVFFLVTSSLAGSATGLGPRFKTVIFLYLGSTVIATIIATVFFYAFPVTITLPGSSDIANTTGGFWDFISNLLLGMIGNPLNALISGNYLCILFWAVVIGLVLRSLHKDKVTEVAKEIAEVVTKVVRLIIEFAPIGIMCIVYNTVSENGVSIFTEYGALIVLLVASMAVVMFLSNPLIGGLLMKRNPYPLLYKCLRESGVTAFFTRSSAANIPVNMVLCEKLGLDRDFYSVSIPLGATINMNGAAVTITIMTLCAAFTLGIDIPITTAIVLCVLSTIAACGASGVSGGSLLLIPMACSFFGIPEDTAMLVVAVGFVIGVIQDSMETALNSSGDVFYTAVAEVVEDRKNGTSAEFNF